MKASDFATTGIPKHQTTLKKELKTVLKSARKEKHTPDCIVVSKEMKELLQSEEK